MCVCIYVCVLHTSLSSSLGVSSSPPSASVVSSTTGVVSSVSDILAGVCLSLSVCYFFLRPPVSLPCGCMCVYVCVCVCKYDKGPRVEGDVLLFSFSHI